MGRACAPAGAGEGWLGRRSRAPWTPFPSPTTLLRPRGHRLWGRGPWRARARPSRSSRWRALRQVGSRGRAFYGSTRHPNPARGRRGKSARAVSARAPHPRAVLSPRHPPSAGGSVESRWQGCLRPGGAGAEGQRGCGGGGVRVLALGIRGLHRATRSCGFAPRRSRPCEGTHKASGFSALYIRQRLERHSRPARAHTLRPPPLGPKPWTSGAFGFPGWGLRVEPSLGK